MSRPAGLAPGNFAMSDAGASGSALSYWSLTRATAPMNPEPSPITSVVNDVTVAPLITPV